MYGPVAIDLMRLETRRRAAAAAARGRALVEAARATATPLGAGRCSREVGTPARQAGASELTPREQEVLALVHLSDLTAKLGASSRTEPVVVARGTRLLG